MFFVFFVIFAANPALGAGEEWPEVPSEGPGGRPDPVGAGRGHRRHPGGG